MYAFQGTAKSQKLRPIAASGLVKGSPDPESMEEDDTSELSSIEDVDDPKDVDFADNSMPSMTITTPAGRKRKSAGPVTATKRSRPNLGKDMDGAADGPICRG